MAIAPNTGRVTPADDLRQLLSQSEERLINLSDQTSAADLYSRLDQIADLMPQIQATGGDVRAEEARWQSLQERILARGPRVLRAWHGSAHLASARLAASPDAVRWWWWIDQRVAEQRRRRLRRIGGVALALLAIVAVAAFALPRLFPVDPAVRESYRLQLRAETALANGDIAAGYQALDQAIAVDPGNHSLLILHGVVADVQGDSIVAEQSWQQARNLLSGDEAQFLTERGLSYLRVQQVDRSIDDLQAAIVLDPASARAHLVLGSALEVEGRYQEALKAYQQAADLAAAADNAELTVMARSQLANLLQRQQAVPQSTP
ncbi:MAG TPA: tetratricopeptide repeat protein [Anaerolineae bacterium]|nr:tetratricopeptide repeat protein [Anaerolineae bacterium]